MKFACVLLILIIGSLNAEVLVEDNFVTKKLEARKPARGNWQIKDGVIAAKFDAELFKKYKNHGPIVWYDIKTSTDCTINLEYKISGAVDTVMFSVNDKKGHVYRTTLKKDGKRKGAFTKVWNAEKKSSPAGPLDGFEYTLDKWLPVRLTFVGTTLTVKIGESSQTYEHEGFAREKAKINFQFSGDGEMQVRNVKVTAP
ncbi:MAG: hypothetical protein NE330_00915 [Lentisphaeraceae bacterium]|nr:hypothetical protein [Lentisphaeraceae bacterium]